MLGFIKSLLGLNKASTIPSLDIHEMAADSWWS